LSRRGVIVLAAVTALTLFAAEKTPYNSLAALASALSQSDADGALEFFDSNMASFADIEKKIEALTAQDDISCSIDVVSDTETNGAHKLDLDWFMQIKSQGDSEQLERRRERVQVEMRQVKGAWKITSMTPLSVLDPIAIK
jgi:hypothetical protein